jgi:uncharacterized protein (TIGR03437 family)
MRSRQAHPVIPAIGGVRHLLAGRNLEPRPVFGRIVRPCSIRALSCALLCSPLAAQPAVPSEFQTAYSQLSTQLSGSTLTKGWDQSKFPVFFGVEGTPASAYTNVLTPGYYEQAVTPFLNAVQSLGGVQIVKVLLHFPLLYPPFYANWPTSGGMAAYNGRLAFYQRLTADVHARGMKLIIQSMAQGFGATASISADPLNLAGYYHTLTFNDYVAGRAAQALSICQLLHPDYLNFESEPDTESGKSTQAALDPSNQSQFVANNLTLVTTIRNAILNANPPIPGLHTSLRLAIGMGSWETYLTTFIANYTQMTGIDVIDIHVHPINDMPGSDYLANIGTIAAAAIAQGKSVGMDETWIYHEANSQVGQLADSDVEARDNWSFWEPMDQTFLTLMMNLANFKRMEYVSFSEPDIFFSYLDYAHTPGCPTPPSSVCTTDQWDSAANQAVSAALSSTPVPLTPTGQTFRSLLAAQAAAPSKAAVFSAALSSGNIAPDSLISIFGSSLATSQGQANSPFPVSLAGSTATALDSAGDSTPLGLLFVSPAQINAYVPAGLPSGTAVIAVHAGNGALSQGTVGIAPVAPGIFTADGVGLAAALVVAASPGGAQSVSYTTQCTASGCNAVPIDLGAASNTVVLELYGTGIRGAAPGSLTASVGGQPVPVLYAGAQGQYAGLDQVNVSLPHSLAGRGVSEVILSAGGVQANTVTVTIQ